MNKKEFTERLNALLDKAAEYYDPEKKVEPMPSLTALLYVPSVTDEPVDEFMPSLTALLYVPSVTDEPVDEFMPSLTALLYVPSVTKNVEEDSE